MKASVAALDHRVSVIETEGSAPLRLEIAEVNRKLDVLIQQVQDNKELLSLQIKELRSINTKKR